MAHRTLSMRGKRWSSLSRQEIELFGLIAKRCIWQSPNTSHLDYTIPMVKQGSCGLKPLSCRDWETGQDRESNELGQIQICPWGKSAPQNWKDSPLGSAKWEKMLSDCLCSVSWSKSHSLQTLSKQCDKVWARAQCRKSDAAQVCKAGCGTPNMT